MLKYVASPLAALIIATLGSATFAESNEKNAAPPSPSIKFLRPLKDERFFDYPIYVQVNVSGFNLVAPGDHHGRTRPNTGYIQYKFDDYPVVVTDDTQFMIGKKLGSNYLPVGLHVLKAELVDEAGKPLEPAVEATTEVFTGHPAVVEAIHTANGSEKAELTGQELYQMRVHLEQLENELKKLKAGNAGYTPTPVSGPGQE